MTNEKREENRKIETRQYSVQEVIVRIFLAIVLISNFVWFLFDIFLQLSFVRTIFESFLPLALEYYQYVERNFIFIDFLFVSIYFIDFVLRWIHAIRKNIYHRWFFFPIIKWYETLNCLPVYLGGWIIWLRIVTLILRLHHLHVIDFTRNFIYKIANKYWAILIEEVSDRVVVNVIEGIQSELHSGSPVLNEILRKILFPQKDLIAKTIIKNLQVSMHEINVTYEMKIKEYVEHNIEIATRKSQEFNQFKKIPIMGSIIEDKLQKVISEIVTNVILQLSSDLQNQQNTQKLENVASEYMEKAMIEVSEELNTQIGQMLIDALEIIKQYVKIQQWKEKEIAERNKFKNKQK